MKNTFWIKLYTDIYENRKMKKLLGEKNGAAYGFVWVAMLVLASRLSGDGRLIFTKGYPYTTDDIAMECGLDKGLVKSAVELFLKYGMLKETKGVLRIKNYVKYQNPDEYKNARERQAKYTRESRQRKKEANLSCSDFLTKEEMEKLRLQILEKDIWHYVSVTKNCIELGKKPNDAYKFIVEMATEDKKLKVQQNRGINQGRHDEDDRLKLPDEELDEVDRAYKHALERSYAELSEPRATP